MHYCLFGGANLLSLYLFFFLPFGTAMRRKVGNSGSMLLN
jgi:hypothetical protein